MSSAASHRTVVVVGAGIVGVCIAYALVKRGLHVTLVDRDEPGSGCSFGNSGAISPGSVAPLAMPGVIASVPRMLRDPESPLYLPLAYLPRALPWLLRFVSSATPARVAATAQKLDALHRGAVDAHLQLAREVEVRELIVQRGHLHLYPDRDAWLKDDASWRLRAQYGYAFELIDRAGIEALEPRVSKRYTVAAFLPDHATVVNPFRYVQAIARAFVERGGHFVGGTVASVTASAGAQWQVNTERKPMLAHEVVIAAGAWSNALLAPLGVSVPLESQRGYHVQYRGPPPVSRTVVLADKKIFVTPMEEGLRVGGTVEIAGLYAAPDTRRAGLLARLAQENFEGLDATGSTVWMGHRPCTPDSMPVIGRAPGHRGLWLAVGHGHLGLTDSVNTATRITDEMLAA